MDSTTKEPPFSARTDADDDFEIDARILEQYLCHIGTTAFVIYSTFARFANKETHRVSMRLQDIQSVSKICRPTIIKCIKILVEYKLVRVYSGSPNTYEILLIDAQDAAKIQPKVKPSRREKLMAEQDYKCHYCGCTLTKENSHVDHKHPRILGGRDCRSNVVASCATCNLRKHDTPYKEFVARMEAAK